MARRIKSSQGNVLSACSGAASLVDVDWSVARGRIKRWRWRCQPPAGDMRFWILDGARQAARTVHPGNTVYLGAPVGEVVRAVIDDIEYEVNFKELESGHGGDLGDRWVVKALSEENSMCHGRPEELDDVQCCSVRGGGGLSTSSEVSLSGQGRVRRYTVVTHFIRINYGRADDFMMTMVPSVWGA
ncbi:hypothetical protein CPC08DRAFT_750849 [Agrocybe pediades]|nr:hypothetical protein CPC08DRAFT_750849 [Agrocybe pediades]